MGDGDGWRVRRDHLGEGIRGSNSFSQMGGVRPIEREIPRPGKTNEFVFPGRGISLSILLIAWPCLQISYTLVSRLD